MTKKIENSPTAKTRIREYLSDNGLSVRSVELQCGYSNGFLSAGGEIGSDRLARFVENYPDSDLFYIVTGVRSRRDSVKDSKYEEFREKIARICDNKEQIDMAFDIAISAIDMVSKTYAMFMSKAKV